MSKIYDPADTLIRLLKAVGEPSTCRDCKEKVVLIFDKSGERLAYTQDGIVHWVACTPASRINRILRTAGHVGTCSSCRADIIWLKTKNDRNAIYNRDGVSHWATCPNAQRHHTVRTGT